MKGVGRVGEGWWGVVRAPTTHFGESVGGSSEVKFRKRTDPLTRHALTRHAFWEHFRAPHPNSTPTTTNNQARKKFTECAGGGLD